MKRPETAEIFSPGLDFETKSREIWEYQYATNPVIREFSEELGRPGPHFIPIRFFKDREMICSSQSEVDLIFESSGTTGQVPSRHLVRDSSIYRQSALEGFFHFYPKQQYRILGLLPGYLERSNSSLVHMVKLFMDEFGLPGSGFYLNDFDALEKSLSEAAGAREPVLLIGVAFGLLDFAEKTSMRLAPESIVMETGGMKGRKKEMVREELHGLLSDGLGVETIHSEYGMTELLSQAYALSNGRFRCPPWMRIVITDPSVPSIILPSGRIGRINVIDLANINSCSFIRTDDLGRELEGGGFEVLGRLDTAELRGCNLMVSQ